MIEAIRQILADNGYLSMSVSGQVATLITGAYTAYRVTAYGIPSAYKHAASIAGGIKRWLAKPSKVETLRREVEELKRALGA